MKKYVAILLTLMLMLTVAICPVSAADFSASSSLVENTLTVTGTGASGLISILILDESQSASTISNSNKPAMIEATLANTDGTFTMPIILSAGLVTGRYKVHVTSGTNTWTSALFTYVNPGELAALSSNVNLATSGTAIQTLLEPFQVVLQMPDLGFTSEYLFKIRPATGFTQTSLNDELQRSAALYYLGHGAPLSYIEPYKDYLVNSTLGIDCFEQYKNLGTGAQADYLATVSGLDLQTLTALEDLYGVGLVSAAGYTESWQELQQLLLGSEEGNGFFNEKIVAGTKYSELNYPENVFKELFRQKSNLTTLSAIKSHFSVIVGDVYDDEHEDSRGNGGGGGGGGGSSSVIWGADAGKILPVPETNKPVQNQPQTQGFRDVVGHWGESQINSLVSLGVVSGYPDGGFYPDNAVTRAEFIKMVCNLFNLKSSAPAGFADVSADAWYAPFVSAAKEAGLVQGDAANSFNPNNTISRQDAAVILSRLLNLEGVDATAFADSDTISEYAGAHVGALHAQGLISGMDDGSFSPLSNTTRAQTAKMLLNCKNWKDQGGAR